MDNSEETVAGPHCEACQSLTQELEKVRVEQSLNYTTLKEKIISTDLLIKKYTSKCQELDTVSKKTEELTKKLDQYKRDCELLEERLTTTLKENEPLKQEKIQLQAHCGKMEEDNKNMRERLDASEASNRIFSAAQKQHEQKVKEFEDQIQQNKPKIKEFEQNSRKQDALIKKLQADLSARKIDLSEQKKLTSKIIAIKDKAEEKSRHYEEVLRQNGLFSNALQTASRGLRRKIQIDQRKQVKQEVNKEDVSSDEELLLEKLFEDIETADIGNLFRPIGHALSPLPPSPPTMEEDESDSDDESIVELAGALEDEILKNSPSRQPARKKMTRGRGRPRANACGRGKTTRSLLPVDEQELKAVTFIAGGMDSDNNNKPTRLVESGLSSQGVLALQESWSDPEADQGDEGDYRAVPFQYSSPPALSTNQNPHDPHDPLNQSMNQLVQNDLSLSASSTSESESDSGLGGDNSIRRRRSPRHKKKENPDNSFSSTAVEEGGMAPAGRRRTRSMGQDSGSDSDSAKMSVPTTAKSLRSGKNALSNPKLDTNQNQNSSDNPFKEPLPVSPRRSRRRSLGGSTNTDFETAPQTVANNNNNVTMEPKKRVTRSQSGADTDSNNKASKDIALLHDNTPTDSPKQLRKSAEEKETEKHQKSTPKSPKTIEFVSPNRLKPGTKKRRHEIDDDRNICVNSSETANTASPKSKSPRLDRSTESEFSDDKNIKSNTSVSPGNSEETNNKNTVNEGVLSFIADLQNAFKRSPLSSPKAKSIGTVSIHTSKAKSNDSIGPDAATGNLSPKRAATTITSTHSMQVAQLSTKPKSIDVDTSETNTQVCASLTRRRQLSAMKGITPLKMVENTPSPQITELNPLATKSSCSVENDSEILEPPVDSYDKTNNSSQVTTDGDSNKNYLSSGENRERSPEHRPLSKTSSTGFILRTLEEDCLTDDFGSDKEVADTLHPPTSSSSAFGVYHRDKSISNVSDEEKLDSCSKMFTLGSPPVTARDGLIVPLDEGLETAMEDSRSVTKAASGVTLPDSVDIVKSVGDQMERNCDPIKNRTKDNDNPAEEKNNDLELQKIMECSSRDDANQLQTVASESQDVVSESQNVAIVPAAVKDVATDVSNTCHDESDKEIKQTDCSPEDGTDEKSNASADNGEKGIDKTNKAHIWKSEHRSSASVERKCSDQPTEDSGENVALSPEEKNEEDISSKASVSPSISPCPSEGDDSSNNSGSSPSKNRAMLKRQFSVDSNNRPGEISTRGASLRNKFVGATAAAKNPTSPPSCSSPSLEKNKEAQSELASTEKIESQVVVKSEDTMDLPSSREVGESGDPGSHKDVTEDVKLVSTVDSGGSVQSEANTNVKIEAGVNEELTSDSAQSNHDLKNTVELSCVPKIIVSNSDNCNAEGVVVGADLPMEDEKLQKLGDNTENVNKQSEEDSDIPNNESSLSKSFGNTDSPVHKNKLKEDNLDSPLIDDNKNVFLLQCPGKEVMHGNNSEAKCENDNEEDDSSQGGVSLLCQFDENSLHSLGSLPGSESGSTSGSTSGLGLGPQQQQQSVSPTRPSFLPLQPSYESNSPGEGDEGVSVDTPESQKLSAVSTPQDVEDDVCMMEVEEEEGEGLGRGPSAASRSSDTPPNNLIMSPPGDTQSPMSPLPPSPMNINKHEHLTPLSPFPPSDQSDTLSPLSFTFSDTEDIGDPISPLPPSPVYFHDNQETSSPSDGVGIIEDHEQQSDELVNDSNNSKTRSPPASHYLCTIKDSDTKAGPSTSTSPHDLNSTPPPIHQPKARIAHRASHAHLEKAKDKVERLSNTAAAAGSTAKGKATPGIPAKSSKKKTAVNSKTNSVSHHDRMKEETRGVLEKSKSGSFDSDSGTSNSSNSGSFSEEGDVVPVKRARPSKRKSTDTQTSILKKMQCKTGSVHRAVVTKEHVLSLKSLEKELMYLIRRRNVDTSTLVKKIESAYPSGGKISVVDAILKACMSQDLDLLSTLYTKCCTTPNTATWEPFLADHELSILSLVLHLDKGTLFRGILQPFLSAVSRAILAKNMTSVLVRVSLCRIFTAICRQKGDVNQTRVLLYDIIESQAPGFTTLTLGVACVWPGLLCRTLARGPQKLIESMEHVVMKRVTGEKIRLTKLATCLKFLCQWTPPQEGRDASWMAQDTLEQLTEELNKPSPNHENVYEMEQSLVLLGATEEWSWTNNVLTVEMMWPQLQAWCMAQMGRAPSSVTTRMAESLIRVTGYVMSKCPASQTSSAEDIIKTTSHLVHGVPGATIPSSVQRTALLSLLRLAPFDPPAIAGAANAWVSKHAKHLKSSQQEESLVNSLKAFRECYKDVLSSDDIEGLLHL